MSRHERSAVNQPMVGGPRDAGTARTRGPLKCLWLGALLTLLVASGCTGLTAEQIRQRSSGDILFNVGEGYQRVYQRVLQRAHSCYPGASYTVHGNLVASTGRAVVSISGGKAGGMLMLTLRALGGAHTSTDIYYSNGFWHDRANAVAAWIKGTGEACGGA